MIDSTSKFNIRQVGTALPSRRLLLLLLPLPLLSLLPLSLPLLQVLLLQFLVLVLLQDQSQRFPELVILHSVLVELPLELANLIDGFIEFLREFLIQHFTLLQFLFLFGQLQLQLMELLRRGALLIGGLRLLQSGLEDWVMSGLPCACRRASSSSLTSSSSLRRQVLWYSLKVS
jgi:hypothetical protein